MNESSPIDTATATELPPKPANPAANSPAAATPQPAGAGPAPSVVTSGNIGVLMVNLGTPDSADAAGVRRYLKEFLSDPRVIENQGPVWQLILNGFILRVRPRVKAHDYQKIWNREQNESPLKTITRSQAEKLASTLAPLGTRLKVDWAMRYGNPSIASRLQALTRAGCDRILIMPLYPQYSAATTATVCDEVLRVLSNMRRQPTVRFAPPYYDDPVYIEALASTTTAALKELAFQPDVIVASFHGMPQLYIDKGDPYYEHCVETTRLLRQQIKMDETKLLLTFQSRFGRGKWLEPATIETMRDLGRRGVKNVAVLTPGFSADCLETLEEIAGENADVFRKNGGENFALIPCLNDSGPGMLVLWQLALRELKGWI